MNESYLSVLQKFASTDKVFQDLLDKYKENEWIENDESNVIEAQNKERVYRIKYAHKLSDGIKHGFCYYLDDNGELIQTMYPICQYAKIMNLPDDIKPDWLEAAKKAIQYANEGKWILTASDKSYILKAEQRIKEIEANRC